MSDGSSLIVGPISVPDVNREFYWKGRYFESLSSCGEMKLSVAPESIRTSRSAVACAD